MKAGLHSIWETSERTVKAHRQRVMEKLHAMSVAELVSNAEQLGILNSIEAIGPMNETRRSP